MQTGFEQVTVLTLWRKGQPDLLPDGMEFWYRGHKFRHRPNGYTDGMSSPQFTHAFSCAEPRGWAFMPAVAHDGAYHGDVETFGVNPYGQQGWFPFSFTKDEADVMFKELLDAIATNDEERAQAIVFYEAVHLSGH